MDSLEEKEINWIFDGHTDSAEDPLAMHIKVETDEQSRLAANQGASVKSEPNSPFAGWSPQNIMNGLVKQEDLDIKIEAPEGGIEVIEADRRWVLTDQFSSLYRAMFGTDHCAEGRTVAGTAGDWNSGCRCRTCNNVFPNMVNLYGHACVVNSSGGGNRKVYVYLCKICTKFFITQALLKEHLLRHASFTAVANRRQETCYKLLQYRRKHIRICVFLCKRDAHSNRQRRSCNFCQEVIVTSRKDAISFDRGIRTLVAQTPVTCYLCNGVIVCSNRECNNHHNSIQRSSLTSYKNVNEICAFCNKSYNVAYHLRMHNEEAFYYCHF